MTIMIPGDVAIYDNADGTLVLANNVVDNGDGTLTVGP